MSVLIDNASTASINGNSSNAEITGFTIGSNTNRRLFVAVTFDGTYSPVSGVTHNAKTMTLLGAYNTGANRPVYVYEMIAPDVGTYPIEATFSGSNNTPAISALSVHNAYQGDVSASTATGGGSGSDLTVSGISAVSGDMLIGFVAWNNVLPDQISDGDPGQLVQSAFSAGQFYVLLAVSTNTADSVSEIMSWAAPANANGAFAFSLPDAGATGPNTPVNPSVTDLLATSARLNWEQG